MTSSEARFILRAHRRDGRYAPDDPLFREALAAAQASPELAAWLEREHALDATLANQLEAIQPPAALRETILAGARASRLKRPAWRQPRWLALAAGITIIASVGALLMTQRSPSLNAGAFAHLALSDYTQRAHNHDYGTALMSISESLGATSRPLTSGLDLSPEQLRAANCTTLSLGNREAYEVCFQRDGVWFHLYVTKLDHAGRPEHDRRPVFMQQDGLAAAAWSDGAHLYSLVTYAGPAALAKVV